MIPQCLVPIRQGGRGVCDLRLEKVRNRHDNGVLHTVLYPFQDYVVGTDINPMLQLLTYP